MLIVISPAKKLDYKPAKNVQEYTEPQYLDHSNELIADLRQLTEVQIAELMSLSPKLAALNHERYASWKPPFAIPEAKQALLAFKGDVYTGLAADDFTEEDLRYAQQHLRILSGLYGLLRPLDLMHPYRLEMGTSLATARGKNLYQFWGDTITQELQQELQQHESNVLINLASTEYFKVVRPQLLQSRVITVQFKELKDDTYKIIGIYAKKARGLMSRYILQNRIDEPEPIKQFNWAGYRFNTEQTEGDTWVFTRP